MAEWFRRSDVKIKTVDKKDTAEGIWVKCPRCSQVIYRQELRKNQHVCMSCSHHFRISSSEYFKLLLDDENVTEIGANIRSVDPLEFKASKNYQEQLKKAIEQTGLNDAVKSVIGVINGFNVVLAIMDFSFIGGSMGSAVGEIISRSITTAQDRKLPLIIITSSGGARMQEGLLSLMQMAKTTAALNRLHEAGLPYISVLTDPTMGGVSASIAMLGDVIIAEPNALIGFAGPRVIEQTVRETLPEGFQRAEFLLEHGAIDMIVARDKMSDTIASLLKTLAPNSERSIEGELVF